jgi:hypothetical protein
MHSNVYRITLCVIRNAIFHGLSCRVHPIRKSCLTLANGLAGINVHTLGVHQCNFGELNNIRARVTQEYNGEITSGWGKGK